MSHELKAVEFNVKVLFDTKQLAGDPFRFQVGDDAPTEDFVIEIHSNVAVIRFYLQTLTQDLEHLGTFATAPIQWLTPAGTASPIPSCFLLQRDNDLKMTLVDLNSIEIQDKVSFNFEIAVVYRGRTYTSPDPTIINVQPPPPPPQDEKPQDSRATGEFLVS